MVHSFAIAPSDTPTGLTKDQDEDWEGRGIYADAGFTALADQEPLVMAARAHYPEMGEDRDDFFRFFSQPVDMENYNIPTPLQVATEIKTARSLFAYDSEVFDRVELRRTDDGSELLAIGVIKFGLNVLHFPIVQWHASSDRVDDRHTSIEEIKEQHRKEEQERADYEQRCLEEERLKEQRNNKLWGYPLLSLALLLSLVLIYAPLAKAPDWLLVGMIGSCVVAFTGMVRVMLDESKFAKFALAIAVVNVTSVIFSASYLTHIGVIK